MMHQIPQILSTNRGNQIKEFTVLLDVIEPWPPMQDCVGSYSTVAD